MAPFREFLVGALAVLLLAARASAGYLAGVGVGDITGPVADVNLMGYAMPLQTAQGLHTRLYARAFLFADAADPGRRLVYVSMDACMASQLVTLRVVQRLQAEYGSLYSHENVAISGTHTHASPAGFLQYLLYDITSLGFVQATFDAMVEGVLTAIRRAHASLRPASVRLAAGELRGASINRSPTAYLANPPEERAMYDADVDTSMALLRLEDAGSGAGLGALGWFAVHCTSLNNTNRLVSADNKGAAQLLLEAWAAEAEARAAALEAGSEAGPQAAEAAGDEAARVSAAAAAAAATSALGLDLPAAMASSGGGKDRGFHFRLAKRPREQPLAEAQATAGKPRSRDRSAQARQQQRRGGGRGLLRFEPGFVAAVAQAAVGDVSPNTGGAFCLDTGLPCDAAHSTCNGRNELCHGRGPAWPDDRTSAAVIGARQAEAARRLYEAAEEQELLSGPLDFRSAYLDLANTSVRPSPRTGGRSGSTCPPAMGMSFAAGTTDGPGAFDFTQGDTQGPLLWRLVSALVAPPSAAQRACQAPKPILLDTGQITVPYLWQPRVTQVSLLRLGRLLVACVPGEFSTMAGRRLKRALAERFAAAWGAGAERPLVVISGLTGTYSSYITTWEEYQVQRYEGASTIFGPLTLDAYIQEFLALADAMIEGRPVVSAVQPPDLEDKQLSFLAPVVVDWVSTGAFGDAIQGPAEGATFRPGETVSATFRAANPRNNLRTNGTFMAVERLEDAAATPTPERESTAAGAFGPGARSALGSAQAAARGAVGARLGGGKVVGAEGALVRGTSACNGQGGDAAEWHVVYDDRDWITRFHWFRHAKLSPESFATLSWDIPAPAPAGTYRLRYWGDAKSLAGSITAFEGCSAPFRVAEAAVADKEKEGALGE
ncbi:hypothetical protein HYH03_005654 [Edaphochlamys debaryana]|uniref:Neutral ceramidase n=1 Tax=Edaphochlamys debaryana TaxID=47281 RepID=A0A835YCP4_9CHLO|nr:hypothetical protein HYH03_005654 [Edaphochlamys debaryana]|eukprot:KAG2496430.1 hypothetical protein HYH03_005654 [Edaphochlamys debaryana]